MKAKTKITQADHIKAVKKADRELEILMYGKQVSMRCSTPHKSKRVYDRNRIKREPLNY